MNKMQISDGVFLIVSGSIVWFTLAVSILVRVPNDLQFSPAGIVLLYIAASFLCLFAFLACRKEVPVRFCHFQAMAAMLPLSFITNAALFLVYARVALGRYPLPNRPDPSSIGLGAVEFLVFSCVSLALGLVSYAVAILRQGLEPVARHNKIVGGLLCVGVWIIFWIILNYDPLRFIEWLGD